MCAAQPNCPQISQLRATRVVDCERTPWDTHTHTHATAHGAASPVLPVPAPASLRDQCGAQRQLSGGNEQTSGTYPVDNGETQMAWLIAAASKQRGWLRFKNSICLLSKFTAPSRAKRRSSAHLSRLCTTQPGTCTRGVNPESGVSPGWEHNIHILFFCWYGILMCWERGKKSNVKLFFCR